MGNENEITQTCGTSAYKFSVPNSACHMQAQKSNIIKYELTLQMLQIRPVCLKDAENVEKMQEL